MIEFLIHNMAPIMFATLVVFLLLGYPVAFALAANGLLFGLIGIELGLFNVDFLQALPQRVFGVMSNETLLAIPFFTFMGLILERSGMAEDLLDTIGQLFGPVRGGLAYAVVFVGALLAATTGVVAASVISMGLISLPIMLRYGYDRRLASGVIAASGTLAQIIPPSLVLIVMADQLGRPVGDMYKGAMVPGLVLSAMYAGYVFLITFIFPKAAPALPPEARSIAEDPALAPRQGFFTGLFMIPVAAGVALMIFALASWLLGLAGVTLPLEPGTPRYVAAAVVGVLIGIALLLSYRRLGDSPRLNTFVAFGLIGVLSYVAYLYLAETYPDMPNDNALVWALAAGVLVVYVVVIAFEWLKVGLFSHMTERVIIALVPPLALIFLVLGTIFIGVATPTEGGAMGATGALILAAAKRRLKFDLIRQACISTATLSSFVIFILIGARVFSLTFYGVNGHRWVEELLVGLPGGETGFLIVVNILIFILAFFLDFFELAFIIIPLLGPAAERLGIDLVWFGVILAVNMQTSFMHPPFGFALFYLRSVAPVKAFIDRVTGRQLEGVTTMQIYWGAVPFVVIQLIMVGLVIAFPALVMHYKSAGPVRDPAAMQIDVPALDLGPGPGGLDFGIPGLDQPPPPPAPPQ